MKRLSLLLLLIVIQPSFGLEPASDPKLAVVRIKSHGASGTIISTTDGKSWILSCAHMFFDDQDRISPRLTQKKIVIDGPQQPYAPAKLASTRLLFIDGDQDLSLIEIDNGPYNYVPIAKVGHKVGKNLHSCGYDEMRWPITHQPATILVVSGDWTYTREKPWHGRSGGGLFDVDGKVLVGVVNGYEITGQERGIYVSLQSIHRFLKNKQVPTVPARPPERIPNQKYDQLFYQPPYQPKC